MSLTAEAILAIPMTAPFRLFPKDAKERHNQFKTLAKIWHPDAGGRPEVFAHISALYDAAENPKPTSILSFISRDGRKYNLQYKKIHRFELGSLAIGQNIAVFIIERAHEDLVLNGLRAIGSIRYPDNRMKEQHARFVPFVERVIETDTQQVIVVRKTPDTVLLRDLITHLGVLDPKHVAWIVSSLLNLNCFYEISGFCHNGLSVDTVFVSPQFHAAFPIGGWWYALDVGKTMKHLPPGSHALAPRDVLRTKKADHRIDLESIRAIARACLADSAGGSLITSLPKPLSEFLRLPAPKSPLKDYEHWEKVLVDSYGPRRFLKLPIDPASDIYV
jgi:hypothetical protein